MKRNFAIAVFFVVLCFLLLVGAIVLNIMEMDMYCVYAGMASSVAAFISVLFGLNSWKDSF